MQSSSWTDIAYCFRLAVSTEPFFGYAIDFLSKSFSIFTWLAVQLSVHICIIIHFKLKRNTCPGNEGCSVTSIPCCTRSQLKPTLKWTAHTYTALLSISTAIGFLHPQSGTKWKTFKIHDVEDYIAGFDEFFST